MKLGSRVLPIAIAGIVGIALTAVFLLRVRDPVAPQASIDLPELPALPKVEAAGSVVFREIAEQAGLRFTYRNGARGQYHLTETLGGGVAIVDYDGDGWMDLYLVQGGAFPPSETNAYRNRLYRNRGDGTFEDVTASAGVGHNDYGHGCAVGDYDNDGDADLYVTNHGPDVLYRNNGDGTFADVTEAAGLGCPLSGAGCAFGDLDGDGDLDLYVANYVQIDPERPLVCEDALGLRIYCPPPHHRAEPDVLYRNNGDGTFSDVTAEAGVRDADGRGLGVLIADVNRDGHPDIYVANDATANYLFAGDGSLRFVERALESGLAVSRDGRAEGSMGIAYGDYDADTIPDLLVTNFMDETDTLYRAAGAGLFADHTGRAGLAPPTRSMVGWGTQFVDFDNDGRMELFVANGNINDVEDQTGEEYAMRPQLFMAASNGALVDIADDAGPYFGRRWVARGAAFADLDNDGRVDIVVSHLREPAAVLRNETTERGASLTLRLVGRADADGGSSRDALGARVEVEAGSLRLVRDVVGGGSYLSASPYDVHLGLGEFQRIDRLTVHWPSGRSQSWEGVSIGRSERWVVVEGDEPVVTTIPSGADRASGSGN